MYGLKVKDDDCITKPSRKATGMMTNMPAMAWTLNRNCNGRHDHTRLIRFVPGTGVCKTKMAQQYPRGLCKAMVEGVILQQAWGKDRKCVAGTMEVEGKEIYSVAREAEEVVPPEEPTMKDCMEECPEEAAKAYNDLAGDELDPKLVKQARAEDIQYYYDRRVVEKVPRSQ